jgi:hypothetical protein
MSSAFGSIHGRFFELVIGHDGDIDAADLLPALRPAITKLARIFFIGVPPPKSYHSKHKIQARLKKRQMMGGAACYLSARSLWWWVGREGKKALN